MKPCSPELLALLKSRQFFAADVYTISLAGGTVLRYCGGDQDLTVNGMLYPAGKQIGPYFDRKDNKAKVHWKVGVETDTLVVDVIPGAATILGAPFLQAVRNGVFDAAEFMLERLYMPTYGDTRRGALRYFVGRMAELDSGRSLATYSINSHLELLNLQLPRNLYQVPCINNLGDATCQVDLNSFKTTGTISSGSNVHTLNATLVGDGGFAAGTFDQGKMTFTSGALSGYTAGVKSVVFGTPDVINLIGFLPSAPAASDTFTLFFGCDKSIGSNGCGKFTNTARFRGFRWIPQPSTAA